MERLFQKDPLASVEHGSRWEAGRPVGESLLFCPPAADTATFVTLFQGTGLGHSNAESVFIGGPVLPMHHDIKVFFLD